MTFLANNQRVNTTFGKEAMQRLKLRVKWELLTEDMQSALMTCLREVRRNRAMEKKMIVQWGSESDFRN
jgi:hypothetical protein